MQTPRQSRLPDHVNRFIDQTPTAHFLLESGQLDALGLYLELAAPGEYRQPPLPVAPTMALPGSDAKIEVMRARLERGEHLHHPDDPLRKPPGVTQELTRGRNGSILAGPFRACDELDVEGGAA